jgi:hypothetical protein
MEGALKVVAVLGLEAGLERLTRRHRAGVWIGIGVRHPVGPTLVGRK